MHLVSRNELAELCGKTNAYVTQYISRGKVFLHGDNKHFDIDNELNKAFILGFDGAREKLEKLQEKEKRAEIKPFVDSTPNLKKVSPTTIDFIQKQHNLKLSQVKIQKEELDLKKKQGKTIDVDLSTDITQRFGTSLLMGCRESFKIILQSIAEEYEIKYENLVKINQTVDEQINRVVLESKSQMRKDLESVVQEYKNSLNVGERK